MSNRNMLPILTNVEISKDGNRYGKIVFSDLPNMGNIERELIGSLPFSKSDVWAVLTPGAPPPYSDRMRFFEDAVELLALAHDGEIAPFRFRTKDNICWKMDKKAAEWLLASGRYVLVARGTYTDFGLRRRG